MKCGACKFDVGVFSPLWQAQRDLLIKKCPSCGADVEAVFQVAAFATWLAASGSLIAATTFLFSQSASLAFSAGLVCGLLPALFFSIELRPKLNPSSKVLNAFQRPRDFPNWLKPPSWVSMVASFVWGAGTYLFVLIAVTVGVPFPWSAALLVFLGAIGLIRRVPSKSESKAVAIAGKIGAIGMLVFGIGLVFHRYA